MSEGTWRRCSACKEPIALSATYWVCNVSTCNRKRTGMAFCTVSCWEVHLPIANHREAWAVEKTAPAVPEAASAPVAASAPAKVSPKPSPAVSEASKSGGQRRLVRPAAATPAPTNDAPLEVLIVASRLKEYVRAVSGFNTSDRVLEPLSAIVRKVCEEAIRNADRDGRKTVLDRDVPKP